MARRDQHREDTRRRLLQAARRLVDEHGYDATTVDMVASAAGVSARTFHRYFASKDAVVAHPINLLVERVAVGLAPDAGVADLIRALARALEDQRTVEEVAWSLRLHREHPQLQEGAALWRRRWASTLAEALAAGRARPSLADLVRSRAAVYVMSAVADEGRRRPGADLVELAEEAIAVLAGDLADASEPAPAAARTADLGG